VSTALRELLQHHVDAGVIPGAVATLGPGNGVQAVAVGSAALGGGPMREDAIMRIQSMTKPITSVAALRLVESGRLGLDQSVEEWLPELASRRVLSAPTAALEDTVPAHRPITLRHLLTNSSGYGMALASSPLQQAMVDNGTDAGPEPPDLGADAWLTRLAELPLAFQPGEGWRYHHSFGVLGILIARLTGRPLEEHLAEELFHPLGMTDTSFWRWLLRGAATLRREPRRAGLHSAGLPPLRTSVAWCRPDR
jgi:CubicO group peptidase (beta-lactamase class C family)